MIMEKIRCLIVDDEPLAIKVISAHAENVPQLQITGTCRSAMEALKMLRDEKIDLIFLDIQMPGLTGFEMINSIRNPPAVIFTTAFREYAPESYEVNAVDYLLKPISLPRFLQAVNKYLDLNRPQSPSLEGKTISLRANRKTYVVDPSEILFIEGLKDYVKVYLEDGRMLITKERMTEMENLLIGYGFLRTHKSFLIQKAKVSSFTSESVDIDEHEIPVGRTYRDNVLKHLNN
jgi:DNA-binding LytR/AlgR family response regulator